MTPSAQRVTQLLIEWGNGNHAALEELMPVVYVELHKMARRYMNQQNPPHTLQTTALIHEAYLRLAGDSAKQWQNRAHFFGVAAKAMRHVLVAHARTTHAAKRGGAMRALRLNEDIDTSGERVGQLIALDDALTDLAKLHPAERNHRTALFWRVERGGDGGTAESVAQDPDARLAHRQSVAARGTQSHR